MREIDWRSVVLEAFGAADEVHESEVVEAADAELEAMLTECAFDPRVLPGSSHVPHLQALHQSWTRGLAGGLTEGQETALGYVAGFFWRANYVCPRTPYELAVFLRRAVIMAYLAGKGSAPASEE